MNPQVSVIGAGSTAPELAAKAEKVGRLLGENNVTLICGGGGGVMQAACRGLQQSRGGRAVGIIKEDRFEYANDYLDTIICTNMGEARNLAVVLSGQAVIAIGGKEGTLSEIAFAIRGCRINRRGRAGDSFVIRHSQIAFPIPPVRC